MQETSHPKTSVEYEDEVFGGINLLTRSLHDLDERGLVLSLSAFAEDALGSLLKAFLIPSEATSQLLEGFNAPLGTFSSRIKAAYALGLVTKDQFLDLERLRKIRNEFAHAWRPVDLQHQKLFALVKAMSYSRIDDRFPETPIEKIRSAISCVLIELRSSAAQLSNRGAQARLLGEHLVRGFSGAGFNAQFHQARQELANISHELLNAEGEKHVFYRGLLERLSERLPLLARPKTPEEQSQLAALEEEVRNALRPPAAAPSRSTSSGS